MKRWITGNRKGVFLALFLVAAGCVSRCGAGTEEVILAESAAEETQKFQEADLPAEETAQTGDGSAEQSAAPEAMVCVHVCGEVTRPGVYRLPEGSRVYEAVELAGGFTPQAEQSFVNLAEQLLDGTKIEIPNREQAEASGGGAVRTGTAGVLSGASPAKVNINRADRAALMTLNGIGEARAEAILQYRREHGNFSRIEDIMLVPGIKDAAFQKIRDNIVV